MSTTTTNKESEVKNSTDTTNDQNIEEVEIEKPKSKFIFADIFMDSISYSALIFLFLFAPLMHESVQKIRSDVFPYKPANYKFPEYVDLLPGLYYLPIILFLNKAYYIVFRGFVRPLISLDNVEGNKEDEEFKEIYVRKACFSFFKFSFFTWSTILGYNTLKNTNFLSKNFFGSGEYINIYKDPFPHNFFYEKPEGLDFYININHTFAIFDLIELLINPFQTDFLIMILHHLSTCSLIVFSYTSNFYAVGSSVIFLHYYGDIYSYIIKSVIYLNVSKKIVAAATFTFLINFAYTRIYVFCTWIQAIYIGISQRGHWYAVERWLFNFMLILVVLHCLWTYMIGKKFVTYLITGKILDISKVKKKK